MGNFGSLFAGVLGKQGWGQVGSSRLLLGKLPLPLAVIGRVGSI